MQDSPKDIAICIVDSELGAGTRGSSLGPTAVLQEVKERLLTSHPPHFRWDSLTNLDKKSTEDNLTNLDKKSTEDNLAERERKIRIMSPNEALLKSKTEDTIPLTFSSTYCKNIEAIANYCEQLSDEIKKVSKLSKLPVVLSGDHSSAVGIIGGLMRVVPDKRLGVVWIDAHPDLNTPYTSTSGNVHGMSLAALLGEDNLLEKFRKPTKYELRAWEKMKSLGSETHTNKDYQKHLLPEDIVLIAARSIDPAEASLIDRLKIRNIPVEELRKDTKKSNSFSSYDQSNTYHNAVLPSLNHLRHCDRIYISFDIDSLDKALVPGTGTPVEEGLSKEEAIALNTHFFTNLSNSNLSICGWEITEVNPKLDHSYKTIQTAASVLQEVLTQIDPNLVS